MKVTWYPHLKAMYVKLSDGLSTRTIEVEPDVLADEDNTGRLLGVEILNARWVAVSKLFASWAHERGKWRRWDNDLANWRNNIEAWHKELSDGEGQRRAEEGQRQGEQKEEGTGG